MSGAKEQRKIGVIKAFSRAFVCTVTLHPRAITRPIP